jgi:uncharacterized protein YcbK (DUF882 family)
MSARINDVGHRGKLTGKVLKSLFVSAAAVALTVAIFAGGTVAGGETRTISFYHTHTKESITVTYMQNGRYVPSAMKKINYLLRDWRRDSVTRIDPKTIDLVWELQFLWSAAIALQKPMPSSSASVATWQNTASI